SFERDSNQSIRDNLSGHDMKKRFIPAVLTAVALAFGGAAAAQTDNYPNRTIRLITPYSPGSGPDSVARALSDELSKKWGQQVVVENRPGANGTLGVTALKQAKPDGYTLILLDNSMTAINPHLYSDLPYNVEKDLTPLAFVMTTSFYLMVTSNGPIQSVQ